MQFKKNIVGTNQSAKLQSKMVDRLKNEITIGDFVYYVLSDITVGRIIDAADPFGLDMWSVTIENIYSKYHSRKDASTLEKISDEKATILLLEI